MLYIKSFNPRTNTLELTTELFIFKGRYIDLYSAKIKWEPEWGLLYPVPVKYLGWYDE